MSEKNDNLSFEEKAEELEGQLAEYEFLAASLKAELEQANEKLRESGEKQVSNQNAELEQLKNTINALKKQIESNSYHKSSASKDKSSANTAWAIVAVVIAAGLIFTLVNFIIGSSEKTLKPTADITPTPIPKITAAPASPTPTKKAERIITTSAINNIINSNTSFTDYAVYVKNLKTGYTYGLNEKAEYLSSALSYISILYTVADYTRTNGAKLDSDRMRFYYEPNGREKPDSKYDDGNVFSIRDYIEIVAKYGDNNRANMLIDYVGNGNQTYGFNRINSTLKNRGYTTTQVNRKIYTDPNKVDNSALPNVTSAFEIANIFYDLINSGYIGEKNYMKRICSFTDGKNAPAGVRKYLSSQYSISNHNAGNSLTTNEVALISNGSEELLVSVLSTTRQDKTTDNGYKREDAINQIVGYIVSNQFE